MLNFFFNRKKDDEKTNTLENGGDKPKAIVDTFVKFAEDATNKRQSKFERLMNFVLESCQWTRAELNKLDSESDQALVFNFSQEYVERYLARLFPRNPHTGVLEVGVKVTESDKAKNKKYEKEILDIYKQSEIPDTLIEQGNNFLVGGASCFYYPKNPITKRAEIFSIDPTDCYLGFSMGKLVQFAFREYQGKGKFKITYYDMTNIIIKDGLTDGIKVEKNEDKLIPFSWIPNFPRPHTNEGIPKTEILVEMDRLYNRNASNFDKRVEENTQPHAVITAKMVDKKNISRGKNKTTILNTGDDMKYLDLPEGKEIIQWLEMLEKRIVNKTGIVHSAGSVENISGKSLSFQFTDMMDLIGFMRLKWDTAFREMNKAILTYKFGRDVYNTDPVYQPFLMQDNKERVDEYAIMIEKGIITRKDAIDELRGVENAEEKVEEVLAEMKLFKEQEIEQKNSRMNLPD